ncbi:5-formyltetrahydrofolate cyclo-ligase [bacterium]|jgi:5-formyltetrahydrofolate cyclo-ligase|nr:5-formyltetrahydrofolate cyclo-ligase [bacterium]MBT3582159.1 5-formyltetrahydrofolate cyclo-ligase [bacterium]MBT4551739.1 5-formyltetrahydrofolate cyclo-ligase [bacterium]MBT5988296.1 5-formyltetrahydrofolate cyclo-ligase [bacterium]MBT7088159.1 5-formyltetrahydrofolate cyclo-ligase [bacterium]
MKDKKTIRQEMFAKWQILENKQVTNAGEAMCQKLAAEKDIMQASAIAVYMAFQKEINLKVFIEKMIGLGKKVFLPKHDEKKQKYILTQVKCLKTGLAKGKYGIWEPVSLEVPKQQIDYWFVPGVAFDKEGHRLGRGVGYYDRLLKDFSGQKIGVAYKWQMMDKLPIEEWDVKMDKIFFV